MATAPRRGAGKLARAPRKLPMGVRVAETRTICGRDMINLRGMRERIGSVASKLARARLDFADRCAVCNVDNVAATPRAAAALRRFLMSTVPVSTSKGKLLVVEDDADIARALTAYGTRRGFNVMHAA